MLQWPNEGDRISFNGFNPTDLVAFDIIGTDQQFRIDMVLRGILDLNARNRLFWP